MRLHRLDLSMLLNGLVVASIGGQQVVIAFSRAMGIWFLSCLDVGDAFEEKVAGSWESHSKNR